MPNRWVPRRGRGGEDERGTCSGQEGLQVFDLSPRLNGGAGRTGAFHSGEEIAEASVSAMVTPPRRDGDAEETSEGLWATIGATSAFWLDLPAQVNSAADQVSAVIALSAAALPFWTGVSHVLGCATTYCTDRISDLDL